MNKLPDGWDKKYETVVVYMARQEWERIAKHFRSTESPDDIYYGAPWGAWANTIEKALENPGNVRKEPRIP